MTLFRVGLSSHFRRQRFEATDRLCEISEWGFTASAAGCQQAVDLIPNPKRQRGIVVEKRGKTFPITDVSVCENPLDQHSAIAFRAIGIHGVGWSSRELGETRILW